jgi:alpha-glucoside transport system permease protein
MQQALFALATIVVGVSGCVAYFYFSNIILDRLLPARGMNAARNINRANLIRPWLFVGPSVLLLGAYLVYPVFRSIILSLSDPAGAEGV